MSSFEKENIDSSPSATATLDPPPVNSTDPDSSHAAREKEEHRGNVLASMEPADAVVLIAGTISPAIAMGVAALCNAAQATEMVLRHPIETILQYALLLSIPCGNYLVWNRLKLQNLANAKRIGLFNGLAAGTAALVSLACLIAGITGIPSDDGTYIVHNSAPVLSGMLAVCSLLVSAHLMHRLCKAWETEGARNSQLIYSLAGVLLSLFVVGAGEGRQVITRAAEQAALSEDTSQREAALSALRLPLLDSAQELKRDIADPRSGGLSGMLLHIDPAASRKLYFALTSRPYESIQDLSAEDRLGETIYSTSYDRFLASHVVGSMQPGLSLKRSQMRGSINAKTLTSNLEWTFVLKNKSELAQEARAEIALPPGAVVTRMTRWLDGKPMEAVITRSSNGTIAYSSSVAYGGNPASITYLGKGRVLIQCFPVQSNKEVKLSLTMVAPLKLESAKQASLALPRLVASNFTPSIGHDLRFLSDSPLNLAAADLHAMPSNGNRNLYTGTVKDQEAKNTGLSLVAARPNSAGSFAACNLASGGYTLETVAEVPNNVPKHLVVVVDGSKSVKEFKQEIKEMLGKVETLIPTTVLLANSDKTEAPEALDVDAALKQLDTANFEGGHDNLPAVVKAAELAGDRDNSAVLWIHGPQPALNDEIYITSQAASKPSFYELALDDGWTNTSEFFKNHREIGPMIPIMRSGKLGDDLNRFLAQWQPGGHHYSVQLSNTAQALNATQLSDESATELAVLGAAHDCKLLIADKHTDAAVRLASMAHIVSPVTSGVVPAEGAIAVGNLSGSAPVQTAAASASARASANATATAGAAATTAATATTNNDSLNGFGAAEQTPLAIGSEDGSPIEAAASGAVGAPVGRGSVVIGGATIAGGSPVAATAIAVGNAPVAIGSGPVAIGSPAGMGQANVDYGSCPVIQGATNGTIMPAGSDAIVISGVTTCGTVRVNNLANIEAVLNFMANLGEILGLLLGTGSIASAFYKGLKVRRIVIGVGLMVLGLATPGVINWFIATARDSALFN